MRYFILFFSLLYVLKLDELDGSLEVFAAAAQGCTAAFIAAILSAMCEPLDAWNETET